MRLLMLHEDPRNPNIDGQGGGGESLREDLIRGLEAEGHQVRRLGIEDFSGRPVAHVMRSAAAGADVFIVSTIHNFIGWEPLKWLQTEGVPHVVTVNDYYAFCGTRMLLHDGDRSCPAVEGTCDGSCGNGMDGSVVALLNRSRHLTYNHTSAAIMRRHGLRVDYVLPLGVDTSIFHPDHDKRDPEVSVYTSSAWAAWPTKGMHILKQAMEGRPWGANLITGLPRAKVAEVLRRAHVYVFPSCYEETWGLCLTEAMASGCACIATRTAGALEQIIDGRTGLLVDKRDPMQLRKAVERVLCDDGLRFQLQLNAERWVTERRTLQHMTALMEALLQEVVEHGR